MLQQEHHSLRALATVNNIRFNTIMLECIHTYPVLPIPHWISSQDQYNVIVITNLSDSFHKFLSCRINSTFTLHRSQQIMAQVLSLINAFTLSKLLNSANLIPEIIGPECFLIMLSYLLHAKAPIASSVERMIHCNNFMHHEFLSLS